MSTNLWVRSSSERIPVSRIIEGLTVTGGTGNACKTNHSGRAVLGSYPNNARSSSGIIDNRSLIVIGSNLFSPISVFSTNVVGFVKINSYCDFPQWGQSFCFLAFSWIWSGILFWDKTVYDAWRSLILENSLISSGDILILPQVRHVDCSNL